MRLSRGDMGRANGFYRPPDKLIAVSDRLSGDQRMKTPVHEAAHWLADHRGSVARFDAETAAESSAFVVLGRVGIDAGA